MLIYVYFYVYLSACEFLCVPLCASPPLSLSLSLCISFCFSLLPSLFSLYRVCVCLYVSECMCSCILMWIYASLCVSVCVWMGVWLYICVCLGVCMCVRIHESLYYCLCVSVCGSPSPPTCICMKIRWNKNGDMRLNYHIASETRKWRHPVIDGKFRFPRKSFSVTSVSLSALYCNRYYRQATEGSFKSAYLLHPPETQVRHWIWRHSTSYKTRRHWPIK